MSAPLPLSVSDAEQHLFGEALCNTEELPVCWRAEALSPVAAEQFAEHAESLLRMLALVEESASDEASERSNDLSMHRLEAKLQILLEMVGTLLARQSELPAMQLLRWSRRGLHVHADEQASPGDTGLAALQPLPWLPQLLTLPCQVLACEPNEAGGYRLWLAIEPLSPSLEASLERHLFRRHRRTISAARRQR